MQGPMPMLQSYWSLSSSQPEGDAKASEGDMSPTSVMSASEVFDRTSSNASTSSFLAELALALGGAATASAAAFAARSHHGTGSRATSRQHKCAPPREFSTRRTAPDFPPLARFEWERAKDKETGRLRGGGQRMITRVRLGGCDNALRGEVWPLLLGLYESGSTKVERMVERQMMQEEFDALRRRAREISEKAGGSAESKCRKGSESESESAESECSESECTKGESRQNETSRRPSGPESTQDTSAERWPEGNSGNVADEDGACLLENWADADVALGGREAWSSSEEDSSSASSDTDTNTEELEEAGGGGAREEEEFVMWSKIMRLDAVRTNDQWIAFSAQKRFTKAEAMKSVQEAELVNFEHLTPAQQVHAARLVSILEAYAVYDSEIGYCQGMTDLLSPFVALMLDDADAFWSFARFMETARHNFRTDELGIRAQLDIVARILELCDPELFRHLQDLGAEDCIFVYRMVIVLLRRELSFEETVALWEVLWAEAAAAAAEAEPAGTPESSIRMKSSEIHYAMPPARSDFFLFVIAAIISSRRKEILACEDLDEVLCFCNSLAGQLDVWGLITQARALVRLYCLSEDFEE